MNANGQLVVIKMGGSLLSLPHLPQRLGAIRKQLTDVRPLIVCGGGETADVVRRWQGVHGISDETAHWLAFRAVSLNELLLAHLLPQAEVVGTRDAIEAAWNAGRLPILAAESFVRNEEAEAAGPLPHDWSVTSDSIAAWVARRLNASRLVLLKSCHLPENLSLADAADRQLVDANFPTGAANLDVYWVNLRENRPQLQQWRPAAERHQSFREPPV